MIELRKNGVFVKYLSKGTVLKRSVDCFPYIGNHLGIYIGEYNGIDQIAHFSNSYSNNNKSCATIRIEALNDFARGKICHIKKEPKNELHGNSIVNEAIRLYNNPQEWNGKYSFLFKNCEDFIKHCYNKGYNYNNVYGRTQVGTGLGILAVVGLIGTIYNLSKE